MLSPQEQSAVMNVPPAQRPQMVVALVQHKQAQQAAKQQQTNLYSITNQQHIFRDQHVKKKHKKESEALRILQQRGIGLSSVTSQHVISRAPAGPTPAGSTAGGGEDEDDDGFGDGLEEESYSVVSTADLEALGLRKHPDAIAECVSLSSVIAPKATYKSRLPAHVLLGEKTLVIN